MAALISFFIPRGQPYWEAQQFWKIEDGAIELAGCDTYISYDSSVVSTQFDDDSWRQQWTVTTHDAVLLTENGSPTQEWEAHFVDAPYNYALLPGLAGVVEQEAVSCERDEMILLRYLASDLTFCLFSVAALHEQHS